jgi:HD-GYP domain-containing protein (c-di-GMP phosphodiesterase class II)
MGKVLLLGSDRERAMSVRSLLRQDGHQVFHERPVECWREREREVHPDLIVAAVESTDSVLTVPTRPLRGFPPALLFVQHEADFCRQIHLEERLVDRITSPFLDLDLLGRADALIRVRRVIHREPSLRQQDPEDETESSTPRWRGLARRLNAVLRSRIPPYEKPVAPYLEVAARVADWADRRDAFEPGHAERVTSLSAMIGEGLRLDPDETAALLRAAMLHDVGKVCLPVEVLHQREPLEENQLRLIRTHPRRGAALLKALDQDEEVAAAILYHHERPDGSGYYGKQSDGVPRAARILAVAEVYDAMTSSRIKEPMSSVRALDLLESRRGEAFDADCVDALVDKLKPRPRVLPLSPRPRYDR